MNRILTEVAPVVTPQAINSNDTTSTTPAHNCASVHHHCEFTET